MDEEDSQVVAAVDDAAQQMSYDNGTTVEEQHAELRKFRRVSSGDLQEIGTSASEQREALNRLKRLGSGELREMGTDQSEQVAAMQKLENTKIQASADARLAYSIWIKERMQQLPAAESSQQADIGDSHNSVIDDVRDPLLSEDGILNDTVPDSLGDANGLPQLPIARREGRLDLD